MKNIILFFLITAFTFTSCESYLDQKNPNKITSDTFWETEDDFLQALVATYTPLRNPYGGYYNARSIEIRNYRGDDISARNDVDDLYQVHMFVNSPDNEHAKNMFQECYSSIYRANMLLEKLRDSNLSEDFKREIEGEALFLRGIHYFILANEFKDVPLRLIASQSPGDFPIVKSPQSDIYAQVESDLIRATELLPVKSLNNGRANKGAALAYLGKLYIYMEQWDRAISTLEPLTKSPYAYKLTNNYYDNFDLEHEYNSESIFEVTYQKIGAATDRWGEETMNTMMTSPLNRIFGCGDVGGWDIANGSTKLLNILTSELDNNGDFDVRARQGAAWNYPNCIYYKKSFLETVKPANQSKLYIQKYTYSSFSDVEIVPESEINVRAFRYANVLLYLAEAYLEKGNVTEAISYINKIRQRANLKLLNSNLSKKDVMTDLIKQRAIEFFGEGERFYDLRRWGLLEQEIKNSTDVRASNFSMKYAYLPIPSKEIQTNPLCTQTEGW